MKIFQISSEINSGSVGRIAEQIGQKILDNGFNSYIAYGRKALKSSSITLKIGNNFEIIKNAIHTRLTDRHGFASTGSTEELIRKISEISPDLIHLQHLHGYFINVEVLFNFLKLSKIPVVWTFHDCWSFTGHCAHFDFIGCNKWENQCFKCEQINEYPKSLFLDNSYKNFNDKKRLFNSIDNLTIVPVSDWLAQKVKKSFLREHNCVVIKNGIDINAFYIKKSRIFLDSNYNTTNMFVILGVASNWDPKKGLDDFIRLNKLIDNKIYKIILIGLSKKQIKSLPDSIIGVERTENVSQLADFYSAADVFLNLTLEDTYPTTNLEAISCGTPVITYNTGGSPESVSSKTGFVVKKGSLDEIMTALDEIKKNSRSYYEKNCREYAELNFDSRNKFEDYIELYKKILKK